MVGLIEVDKPVFEVKYLAVPATNDHDCYDCEYCKRGNYLKGEWHCAKYMPCEVPKETNCFTNRGRTQDHLDCERRGVNK